MNKKDTAKFNRAHNAFADSAYTLHKLAGAEITRFALRKIGGVAPGQTEFCTIPAQSISQCLRLTSGQLVNVREIHLVQYVPARIAGMKTEDGRMVNLYQICPDSYPKFIDFLATL